MDHTNCMRFCQALMKTFEIPMNKDFLERHGTVLGKAMTLLPKGYVHQKHQDAQLDELAFQLEAALIYDEED